MNTTRADASFGENIVLQGVTNFSFAEVKCDGTSNVARKDKPVSWSISLDAASAQGKKVIAESLFVPQEAKTKK